MKATSKIGLLRDVLGSSYKSNDEHLFSCPKCNHHKQKLSVNVDKNVFKCWVCDYSGTNIYRLIRSYGDYNQRRSWRKLANIVDINNFEATVQSLFEAADEEGEQTFTLPEEFISLVNKSPPISSLPARKYLKDRGVTQEDIIYWKIGYCPYGDYANRIIVPSFNLDGRVNYFVSRSYVDDWRKHMNPPVKRNKIVFNHLYLDFERDLIITEGIFDAIVAGKNSVPILGSTLKETSKLFQEVIENDTPVYLALDPDAEKKAMRLISDLLKYEIELYKVDIDPFGDVSEMGREKFLERKNEATFLNSDSYLMYKISNSL
jgi:DNA primase